MKSKRTITKKGKIKALFNSKNKKEPIFCKNRFFFVYCVKNLQMNLEKYQKLEVLTSNENDQIRDYLLGKSRKISLRNQKKLEKIQKIQALLTAGYSKENVLKLCQKQDFFEVGKSINIRQAYKIYNSCINLYGDISQVNKEAERYFAREKYLSLARKAEEQLDFATAAKIRKMADDVIGLFEHTPDNVETSIFMQNVNVLVTRTNDISVLKKSQGDNTEEENE